MGGRRAGRDRGSRIWSEILRQHTTLHPEFSFLPRKFKIAITASEHDRAAIKVHDIGLRCSGTRTAKPVSRCWSAAASAARRSSPRPSSRSCTAATSSYVEAILRVYNQYGRRDNIYKARIKILVHELGIEKFAAEVEEEWPQMRAAR